MTLAELREKLASGPTGGYITVDSRYDPGYLDSCINTGRAFIACERWKQYGLIPPIYYQKYKPTYDKLAQDEDSCYTIFYGVPEIISLDGRASGIGFIGNLDGLKCPIREVSTLAEMSSFQSDRIMKAGRKAYLLYRQGTFMVWWKNKIKEFELDMIAADPTALPSYNVDYDPYPIDPSDIPKLEMYLLQGSFGLTYKTPIDRVNDQRDVTVPPPVRTNA